jgi:HrpA-like RNA helicase
VLDAIDRDGDVTPLGLQMALLPLDPALARALLAAHELGWAAAAALLQGGLRLGWHAAAAAAAVC